MFAFNSSRTLWLVGTIRQVTTDVLKCAELTCCYVTYLQRLQHLLPTTTMLVHFIHKCSSSTASTTPPVVTRVFQRGPTTQRRVGALQEPGHNSERYFSSHAENASSRYITDGRSQRPEHKETYILQKIDFSVLIH